MTPLKSVPDILLPDSAPSNTGPGETMWIDVIRRMDGVYADLVQSQTELEEQNERLRETREFIGSVLAAMTDIVIVCDRSGRIQESNAALAALLGPYGQPVPGRDALDLFVPEDRPRVARMLDDVRAHRPASLTEVRLAAPDQRDALVTLDCAPRRDHRGRIAGMVIVGRPIGELQRAYHALDHAHRALQETQAQLVVSEKMAALGRLVAGVAHELNNPISFVFANMYALRRYGAAIHAYLQATARDLSPAEHQRLRAELRIDKVLADIGPLVDGTLEGAERVRDIVRDLLRFSSTQEEIAEPIDLARLVATAADWVEKAQRVKPRIVITVAPGLEIVSHKGAIHQILVNLLQNAVDAVADRSDGLVAIDVAPDESRIALRVCDNGPGIDAANAAKIFEPFFTTKPIGSGTGLGLYVSYTLAAKLGGTLDHAPRAQGGACFALRLPMEAPRHG